MRIADALETGAENARTGRELAEVLGCKIRAVTAQIERERRAGAPICAVSTGDRQGYFLAETAEELQDYCNRLEGREAELAETRQALLKVLKEYQGKRAAGSGTGKE